MAITARRCSAPFVKPAAAVRSQQANLRPFALRRWCVPAPGALATRRPWRGTSPIGALDRLVERAVGRQVRVAGVELETTHPAIGGGQADAKVVDPRHHLGPIDAACDHHELVAAVAHRDVLGTEALAKHRREMAQRVVSDLVTAAVVDRLEPAEVEEQDAGACAVEARTMSRRALRLARPVRASTSTMARSEACTRCSSSFVVASSR